MDRILPDSGELAKTIMESSLAEFMQEVGYGFCARYRFFENFPLSCCLKNSWNIWVSVLSLSTRVTDNVRCLCRVWHQGFWMHRKWFRTCRAGIIPTFYTRCRFRCLGCDAGSRTILFLIPDVLKKNKAEQQQKAHWRPNFYFPFLLVTQIRISSKSSLRYSRLGPLHSWHKCSIVLYFDPL